MSEKEVSRYKHATTLLTTYGFGLMGAGLFEPLTKGTRFTRTDFICIVAGAALHGVSVYVVPRGEKEN